MIIDFMNDWTNMEFRRTPGSGGLRGHVADYTEGDIVCVKKNYIFPLCIEVKFYTDLNFSHLLYDPRPEKKKKADRGIMGFWKQCKESATRAEKIPILFMRYNRLPKDLFFVMMPYSFAKRIGMKHKRQFIYGRYFYLCTTRELKQMSWAKVDKTAKKLLGI